MFDAIINNIFILIPIAIFVGLRILEARRKQQNTAQQKDSNIFREKDNEAKTSRPHWEAEKNEPYTGVSPSGMPLAGKTQAKAAPQHRSMELDILSMTEPGMAPIQNTPPDSQPEAFPGKLNYLPALKRALVLSEILGLPKALQ